MQPPHQSYHIHKKHKHAHTWNSRVWRQGDTVNDTMHWDTPAVAVVVATVRR